MRIAALTLALAGAVALVLAGCTSTGHPTATPKPSATPVFASDAAALTAAEKAYRGYETAVDNALSTGDVSRLAEFATGTALTTAQKSAASLKAAGQHQMGRSIIEDIRMADLTGLRAAPPRSGQIYACLDVSEVHVVDSSGIDVGAPGRQTKFPTLITVSWEKNSKLLVSEEAVWDGTDFCS